MFSGFPGNGKPGYNYVRTLRENKKLDKLFILDDFGYKGSYYLLEAGKETPRTLVIGLIEFIISHRRRGYKYVYTMGSSKGGTAAIYFGLHFNVTAVYSGACQYFIGDYLNRPQFAPIVEGMTGEKTSKEVISGFNSIIPKQIEEHAGSKTIIHLLYSKDEHTYLEHTVGLIEDLKKNDIPFVEIVESFPNHDDVGRFFSPYIQKVLENELSTNTWVKKKG